MKTIQFISCMLLLVAFGVAGAQSIRENYTEMTQTEKNELVAAIFQVQNQTNLFFEVADFHANNFGQLHFNTRDGNFPQDVFTAWHRRASFEIEQALQDVNPNLSLPYWDWTVNNQKSDDLWDQNFLGQFDDANVWANLGRRVTAPASDLPDANDVAFVQGQNDWFNYTWQLEGGFQGATMVHPGGHIWVGGTMSEGDSPRDPVFYFHHNMIDKLWQEWEEQNHLSTFQLNALPRYPNVDPNNLVDSRSLGVFYAENQLAELDNYIVSNTFRPDETFYYQYEIQAGDNFIVPNGNKANFESTTEIRLLPGFEARNGSEFVAKIDSDKNFNTAARSDLMANVNKLNNPLHTSARKENVYGNVEDNAMILSESIVIYPNPSSGRSFVQYQINEENIPVSIDIVSAEGKVITSVIKDEEQSKGIHQTAFDILSFPDGMYFCKISTSSQSRVIKFVLAQ